MKIRVFEAFAGYGSQAMALKRLQRDFSDEVAFDFVGISEIDAYAIAAYEAVHGGTPNFGDISEIDWSQAPTSTSLLTAFLVKTFPQPESRKDSSREAVAVPRSFGSASELSRRSGLSIYLWKTSRFLCRRNSCRSFSGG